jgi:hypothetical protein
MESVLSPDPSIIVIERPQANVEQPMDILAKRLKKKTPRREVETTRPGDVQSDGEGDRLTAHSTGCFTSPLEMTLQGPGGANRIASTRAAGPRTIVRPTDPPPHSSRGYCSEIGRQFAAEVGSHANDSS